MCLPLFKKELRTSWKMGLIFCVVLAMYTLMITAMYDPALGDSLAVMAQSMPELFAVFGMANAYTTLLGFLANYLYGFLFIVFPMIFALLLVNKLMVRYVDRGAMAWLLAGPVSRRKLACSQLSVLVLWMVALVVYLTALTLGAGQMLFPGALDVPALLRMNAALLGLLLLFASVCWLDACAFNESGWALGSGGGLCIVFILLNMLRGAGEQAAFCKYLTPITLFDAAGLMQNEAGAIGKAVILYVAAAALFAFGNEIFARKDMSL